MPKTSNTINCPACGKPIPLQVQGDKLVARHACKGQPERDVYETDAAAPAAAGPLARPESKE